MFPPRPDSAVVLISCWCGALPYSLASRLRKGASFEKLFVHALWRSFLLIALGIFLRSMDSSQTYYTFEDTLTQIGLGYPFLFLLGFRSPRVQWITFSVILFGYWLAWALYPIHTNGLDYSALGVPANWSHNFSGFAAHWNKNVNLGTAFDQWFLNLFPRAKPFVANGGGYLTLSFIPTLGTMILGLVAGRWLRSSAPTIPLRRFITAGVIGIAAGDLVARVRNLSHCQTYMDTRLDFVQRRRMFSSACRILLVD